MGIRTYNPTSPGRRNASVSDFAELTPGASAPKQLRVRKQKKGGRNNNGRITTRHQGGGHKRRQQGIEPRRRWVRRRVELGRRRDKGAVVGAAVVVPAVSGVYAEREGRGVGGAGHLRLPPQLPLRGLVGWGGRVGLVLVLVFRRWLWFWFGWI
jgi:hypothetical protein